MFAAVRKGIRQFIGLCQQAVEKFFRTRGLNGANGKQREGIWVRGTGSAFVN